MDEITEDGLFTVSEVECLGACVNAPMMQINNEWFYEDLTPESTVNLLESFQRGEEPKVGPQINRNFSEGPLGRSTETLPRLSRTGKKLEPKQPLLQLLLRSDI
jgi:NADH dehydrogenase (ubiquinone) flavoprotein 2